MVLWSIKLQRLAHIFEFILQGFYWGYFTFGPYQFTLYLPIIPSCSLPSIYLLFQAVSKASAGVKEPAKSLSV